MSQMMKRGPHVYHSEPTTNGTDPGVDIYTWGLHGVDNFENLKFSRGLFITLGIITTGLFAVRLFFRAVAQVRLLVTMNSDSSPRSQRYWSKPRNIWVTRIKKHFLYAPIWKMRHNKEMQIGSIISFGTLPTRLHFIIVMIYLVSNVLYCTIMMDFSRPMAEVVAEFRGRTGVMAVVNMVPLFLLAGRNNIMISMLHISFDTYNIFHRWMGRIVALESIGHTCAWLINKHTADGWGGIKEMMMYNAFIRDGTIATIAFCILILHSPSPVRHAFYETFLNLHIILAATALAGVYMHLNIDKLPQLKYAQMAIAFWSFDRFVRLCKLFWHNVSRQSLTQVKVQALPGEACRVTFEMPRPWRYKPGQYVYVHFPTIAFGQSHPFSVAWSEEDPAKPNLKRSRTVYREDREKGPRVNEKGVDVTEPPKKASMSLVIQKRTGMTAKLYDKAKDCKGGVMYIRGFLEGPYGGHHKLGSYGTTILIAGGVGITYQVGYVRELIRGFQDRSVATRKVTLVWIVRSAEQLEWIRPWMDKILPMEGRRELLKILLFVTRPKSPREIQSTSATIQMFPGKPNIETIIENEIEERIGTVAVTVCGPGTLSDSVRSAVRQQVHHASIDFLEEAFSY